MSKSSFVYFLTNKNNTVLYTGVTRNLALRVAEHKAKVRKGFSKRYGIDKLVYYEVYPTIMQGVSREKQLKNWKREWKNELIMEDNPSWKDISSDVGVDDEWVQAVKKSYETRKIQKHELNESWN